MVIYYNHAHIWTINGVKSGGPCHARESGVGYTEHMSPAAAMQVQNPCIIIKLTLPPLKLTDTPPANFKETLQVNTRGRCMTSLSYAHLLFI